MKWTILWSVSGALFPISLIGLIVLNLIPGMTVSNYFWLVPAFSIYLFFKSMGNAVREQEKARRNTFLDFLERDIAYTRADPDEYSASYRGKIEQAAEPLIAEGMRMYGDHRLPEEEIGLGKKTFGRTLGSPDGTIWVEVKQLRPNLLSRMIFTLFGMGCNFRPILEIITIFENGTLLFVTNAKLPSWKAIPGIRKECHPGKTPEELLRICQTRRDQITSEEKTSVRRFEAEEFFPVIKSYAIYLSSKQSSLPPPTDAELKSEGFSDVAIEKYRRICSQILPYPSENAVAESAVPADAAKSSIIIEKAAVPEAAAVEPPANEIPTVSESAEAVNPEMETAQKAYKSSVSNLGAVVLLSIANMVLLATNADIGFPFSAFFPSAATMFGKTLAEEANLEIFTAIGITFAVLSILVYAGCWLLAKKFRWFILVAFLLFVLDTLLIIPFIPDGGSGIWIDVVFHVWVLWSLYSGIGAWRKMKRLTQKSNPTAAAPTQPEARREESAE